MSKHHGGGFGNGLFVGMILGALLILLFTTRKGRKILRIMSDEGFDKVKDWEKLLDEIDFDDSEELNNDYLERQPVVSHTNGHVSHVHHRIKPTSRLHFRGISKH